jgi:hypothetical protein
MTTPLIPLHSAAPAAGDALSALDGLIGVLVAIDACSRVSAGAGLRREVAA